MEHDGRGHGGIGDQWLQSVHQLAREEAAPAGYTREMIQSAVRIAATVHAVAGVLEYNQDEASTAADAQAA
jgi:hypothetical protein